MRAFEVGCGCREAGNDRELHEGSEGRRDDRFVCCAYTIMSPLEGSGDRRVPVFLPSDLNLGLRIQELLGNLSLVHDEIFKQRLSRPWRRKSSSQCAPRSVMYSWSRSRSLTIRPNVADRTRGATSHPCFEHNWFILCYIADQQNHP